MSRPMRAAESPISPTSRTPFGRNASIGMDAGRKPAASQRPSMHPRHTSAATSSSSIGSLYDGPSTPGPIAETHDNAISTLLQNPIVRTGLTPHSSAPSSLRFPTTRDIPAVTLPPLTEPNRSVFTTYLEQAGGLYELFRRTKDKSDEQRRPSSARTPTADQIAGEGLGYGMQRKLSGPAPLARTTTGDSDTTARTHQRRRSSSGGARRNPIAVAPLSTIPAVYFEDDFRLENPRTFDIVSERSEIAPSVDGPTSPTSPGGSGKKALAANAILQEKLSWYMDTVEIHLISSISTASTSFFAALGSLRGLHEEAADSVEKIRLLRKDLADLDKGMAVGGLDIIAKKRRRENLRRLTDAVEQLEFITSCITECEEQVERSEIEAALWGLTDVEHFIAGEHPPPARGKPARETEFQGALIDLRGIKALEGVTGDISLLRKRVGKAYEVKFMQVLLQDLKSHVDKVPTLTTFARLEKTSSRIRGQHLRTPSEVPAFMTVDDDFRVALREQIKGLARSESIMTSAKAYRDAVLKEFKNLIRRHLPSSTDDDAESMASIATHDSRNKSSQDKSTILARNLRALEGEDAIDMFKKIYSNVSEGLRRLGVQVKVLLDITSSLENPQIHSPSLAASLRNPWSPQGSRKVSLDDRMKSPGTPPIAIGHEEIQQALDLSNLLGEAVDIAQAQVIKVLKVRVEQTTKMDLSQFLQYFTLNRLFADECEAISGRSGTALKTIVNEHIKTFVSTVADSERSKLVQKMDSDKWDARDFADEQAERLKRILQAGTSEIEEWTRLGSISNQSQDGAVPTENGTVQPEQKADAATAAKDKVRPAIIDDEKYILPESAMVVAIGIESYLKLLAGIPTMGSEICSSMLDYLKLFNSRSSQLILGAGATRSAGLKNITTKHLALSSQGLSFVVGMIPYMREYARRHLPSSSALLSDFDKVKRLLQEHQSGIHDKLVEIMTGRATAHVNSMKKITWDAPSSSTDVNKYMETLMKETATLHKVLTRHLPDSSVAMIMQPVLASYQDQWTKAFNAVVIKTASGKERLVRDAEYFHSRISKIEGAESIGDAILKIANDKAIQEAPKPVAEKPSVEKTPAEKPAAEKPATEEKKNSIDGAKEGTSTEKKE